jgi:hypothetical protein
MFGKRESAQRVVERVPLFNPSAETGMNSLRLSMSYLLARNARVEEDLVDQLFNSSEKRLGRQQFSDAKSFPPNCSAKSQAVTKSEKHHR